MVCQRVDDIVHVRLQDDSRGMHQNEVCHLTPCRHDPSADAQDQPARQRARAPVLTLARKHPGLPGPARGLCAGAGIGSVPAGSRASGANRMRRPQSRLDAVGASLAIQGEEDR